MKWPGSHAVLAGRGSVRRHSAAAAAFADAAALEKFPGAKDAIMSYYAANAREGAGNCGAGHMGNIDEASVVSESGDQAVVAVNYTFSATSEPAVPPSAAAPPCASSPSPRVARAGASAA